MMEEEPTDMRSPLVVHTHRQSVVAPPHLSDPGDSGSE